MRGRCRFLHPTSCQHSLANIRTLVSTGQLFRGIRPDLTVPVRVLECALTPEPVLRPVNGCRSTDRSFSSPFSAPLYILGTDTREVRWLIRPPNDGYTLNWNRMCSNHPSVAMSEFAAFCGIQLAEATCECCRNRDGCDGHLPLPQWRVDPSPRPPCS